MQGIVFSIEVEIGQQLYDLLDGIIDSSWYWSVGPGESYYSGLESRFLENDIVLDGQSFIKHIGKGEQYLIFIDIKAFPNSEDIVEINNYKEFMKSSCILTLLVVDSDQVLVFSKENQIISLLYERAKSLGHKKIRLLNDTEVVNSGFSIWGYNDY